MRWAALALLLGTAALARPQAVELQAFWGAGFPAAAPAYFGLQGRYEHAAAPWRLRLDGRLRLGAPVRGEGEAWLELAPAGWLRLRAGFAPWFAAPPAEGSGWGGRAEWAPGGSWRLAAAAEAAGVFGAGLGYVAGPLEAWVWARSDGPAFYARGARGRWHAVGWYRAGYAALWPRRAGLRLETRAGSWSGYGGWRSDTGVFLGGSWRGPLRLGLEGRWNPGRAAAAGLRAEYPLAPGVALAGRFDYAFRPFRAGSLGLELRVDAYAAPASQGE
ncbi:hypothetical protein [Oceanithermus sp.]|uniref:hypothetical protein n=1 Tax=Oceanithermus sp. TaxID=2268145 RepID=UPI00257F7CE8|nr:hypothetical protein [Oceanithermus sp.]